MSDAFVIRPAVDDEVNLLPAIERSASSAFRHVKGLEWLAGSDDITTPEQHRKLMSSGVIFVAENKIEQLVAFISCEILSDCMHIWELDVHADAQRSGLGSRLLQTATAHARDIGLDEMTLTTFRDVAFNAPFYQQLGFQIVADDDMGLRLAAIIKREAASGLPADRRCAMRKIL